MKYSFIYSLSDPRDGSVKYIGKTDKSIKSRFLRHINTNSKIGIKKINWIKSLKKNDLLPILDLIDIVPHEEWIFWEQFYICLFRSWGFELKNSTIGGGGCTGFKHSEVFKQNLKIFGNFTTNNSRKKGYKHSQEVINKIIETKRLRKQNKDKN